MSERGQPESAVIDRVLVAVDRLKNELVETLSAAVRIPSVNPKYPGEVYDEVVGGEGEVSRRCIALGRDAPSQPPPPRRRVGGGAGPRGNAEAGWSSSGLLPRPVRGRPRGGGGWEGAVLTRQSRPSQSLLARTHRSDERSSGNRPASGTTSTSSARLTARPRTST